MNVNDFFVKITINLCKLFVSILTKRELFAFHSNLYVLVSSILQLAKYYNQQYTRVEIPQVRPYIHVIQYSPFYKKGLNPHKFSCLSMQYFLYKTYLFNIPHLECLSLISTKFSHQGEPNLKFIIHRVGNNILLNRLSVINKQIDLDWLNPGLDSFKIKCKSKFIL